MNGNGLINGGEPGTTCARVGCMPSKALIQVAEDYHRRTILGRYGVDGHEAMELDIPEAMEHVQELRDTFVDRVLSNSTDDMGEEFVQSYARFLAPDLLETEDGRRFRAGSTSSPWPPSPSCRPTSCARACAPSSSSWVPGPCVRIR